MDADSPEDRDLEEQVAAERVRIQYASVPSGLVTNVMLGALVVFVVHEGRVSRTALLWLCLVLLAMGIRFAVWLAQRRAPPGADSAAWAHRFTLCMFASALVWGAGAFILAPVSSTIGQVAVIASVIALGAGIAGTTLANPAAIHVFLIVSGLPWAALFALQGTIFGLVVALMTTLYVVGTALRVRGNARTFTELITLRLEVASQRDAAERANLAKSKFLAAASHDLRQPLHAMTLLADALSAGLEDPENRRTIGRLRESLGAMRGLFDALLDISRLDAGIVVPQVRDFRLAPLFGLLEGELALAAREKGLEWRSRAADVAVKSDPVLLEMMLRNLLTNAIRYTERGHIELAVSSSGTEARIEVRDTGIGIAEDKQREVFAEFHQLGNPERDGKKGLGLGLAIVNRLAKLLGHRVELTSAPGAGSCFAVALPVGVVAPLKDAPSDSSRDEPALGSDLAGMVVLVVDDQEAVREGMSALLRTWGCESILADGERAALELIRAAVKAPELIIADYRLREDRTGADAVDAIRRELGVAIPALIVTGDTAPERLREAQASGHVLMHKPVVPGRLRAFLRTVRRNAAA